MAAKSDSELIQEIHLAVTEIKTRCEGCQGQIAEHHRALFGNGTPGLKTRMERVEIKQAAIDGKSSNRLALWCAVLAGPAAAILTVIGERLFR